VLPHALQHIASIFSDIALVIVEKRILYIPSYTLREAHVGCVGVGAAVAVIRDAERHGLGAVPPDPSRTAGKVVLDGETGLLPLGCTDDTLVQC